MVSGPYRARRAPHRASTVRRRYELVGFPSSEFWVSLLWLLSRWWESLLGLPRQFWEIERSGALLTTCHGRIGRDGKSTTKELKDPFAAKKEYTRLTAAKVRRGYVLVSDDDERGEVDGGFAAKDAKSSERDDAILKAPDDPDAYLAYGDWLLSQDESRGQFVAVQVSLAGNPDDADLKNKEAELLAELEVDWFGDLADMKADGTFSCSWRYGFMHAVSLGKECYVLGGGPLMYEALANLPAAKFIRELDVGAFREREGERGGKPGFESDGLLVPMVELGVPKTLRTLTFDVRKDDISFFDLGDVSRLYPQLANLEELVIRFGEFELGDVVLPSLRRFEAVTGGLTTANMKSIVGAQWPELRSLVIYFGDNLYGADCGVGDVEPIFAGQGLDKLEHLGLCNSEFADEIAAALPAAKILKQLTSLDLSKGTLGDDGAAHLVENAGAFKHLQRLDLSRSFISDPMAERLKAAFGDAVDLGNQGDASNGSYRYVQVSE